MSGMLTGIGVGPGDPELMTLKAVRKIQECDVIAIPVSDLQLSGPVSDEIVGGTQDTSEQPEKSKTETDADSLATGFGEGESGLSICSGAENSEQCLKKWLSDCVAYQIALGAVPELADKRKLYLPMPMIKEKEKLKRMHDLAAEAVIDYLQEGKKVVFLTLGDPTVYSTYMYVHHRVKQRGFATEIVPGIPSFCAASARLDDSLVENKEELHVIPASYGIEKSLELPGTKVLMKSGRKMPEVKRILKAGNAKVKMIENCGMENEKVYYSVDDIPENAGYYSLLIVKEDKAEQRK